MSQRAIIFAFLGILLAAGTAAAQEQPRSPALQIFEKAGGTVEFIGTAHGLDGWIVKDAKGEVTTTVYTTADGALLEGMLFGADGISETSKQLTEYRKRTAGASQAAAPGAAEASSSKSEKLYAETEAASWVAIGDKAAPYLYVFINVTCSHCLEFWRDLEPHVKAGKLQVRLVPYGNVAENRDGGAALLSTENPAEAWAAHVNGDKMALDKSRIKEDSYQKIDANTALVKEWRLKGPPFSLYRRPADGILTAIEGRPENMMLLLAEFIK
jgi:thiol:disulfide interchange protein DsbG